MSRPIEFDALRHRVMVAGLLRSLEGWAPDTATAAAVGILIGLLAARFRNADDFREILVELTTKEGVPGEMAERDLTESLRLLLEVDW